MGGEGASTNKELTGAYSQAPADKVGLLLGGGECPAAPSRSSRSRGPAQGRLRADRRAGVAQVFDLDRKEGRKTHTIYTRSSCLLLPKCVWSNPSELVSVIQEPRTAGDLSAPAQGAPCAPPAPGAQAEGLRFRPWSVLPLGRPLARGGALRDFRYGSGAGFSATGGPPPTQTLRDRPAAARRASAPSLPGVATLRWALRPGPRQLPGQRAGWPCLGDPWTSTLPPWLESIDVLCLLGVLFPWFLY